MAYSFALQIHRPIIHLRPKPNAEAYAAAFGDRRHDLAPDGCVDGKNQGWAYVSA
ncbi:MAG: hypothetical protein JWL86_4490 [Rhizobium sp.]|nr:hypothetical protein [Rhizobium sp.]